MSSGKHVAKHRAPRARRAPKAALKTSLTLSSMAVVATGFAVGAGGFLGDDAPAPAAAANVGAAAADDASAAAAPASASVEPETAVTPAPASTERAPEVTRSQSRVPAAEPKKVQTLSLGRANAVSRTEDLSDEDPRDVAQALLGEFGFSSDQFGCLDSLWTRESGWSVTADNPSSSAYGIPQALPGSKMSSAGADWATNPVTQIRWGLGYIQDRYGSPCSAWGHSQSVGWY